MSDWDTADLLEELHRRQVADPPLVIIPPQEARIAALANANEQLVALCEEILHDYAHAHDWSGGATMPDEYRERLAALKGQG